MSEDLERLDARPAIRKPVVYLLLTLGIAFDLAINGQYPGASLPLLFAAAAAALAIVVRDVASRALLAGGVAFAIFPALRASTGLTGLDVSATLTLFGTAVAVESLELEQLKAMSFVLAAARLLRSSFRAPRLALLPLLPRLGFARGRGKTFTRIALITIPVLALFARLLGSADRVFADVITPSIPGINLGSVVGHVALTVIGTVFVATLWLTAVAPRVLVGADLSPIGDATPGRRLAEWATLLVGLDALFGIFVAVQFAFLFDGRKRILVTPGLTYAEYARSGFFQLLVVAVLTVALIMIVWDFAWRENPAHRRWFRAAVTPMIAFSLVILVSALKRLRLYEQAFGFTVERFFAYLAIALIGVVLLIVLGAVWTGQRRRVLSAVLAASLAALMVANLLNPERFVARRNVGRFQATGKIDSWYLGAGLGPDAIPVATTVLIRLRATEAATLRSALCEQLPGLAPEPSWRSWNAGRDAARRALRDAGITAERCAR
ncbi:MAG: DUF4153 domain-containing protein [Actinomycetota bacterium]|nr:DUF4173 domain-containing protein [Actinomycetota bacterium]